MELLFHIGTWRPPWAYKCLCIRSSIVGTLFPLESNESCIDSVETPKTVVLQIRNNKHVIDLANKKLQNRVQTFSSREYKNKRFD